MTTDRSCGECAVCCEVAEIPGLTAAHEPCQYQRTAPGGSCSVFNGPERDPVCHSFQCSWLRGLGGDDDRPDRIGAMFSINSTGDGKVIGFVSEQVEGAIEFGPAGAMAVTFARQFPMPLMVVPFGSDQGEFVILHDSLRERAAAMIGSEMLRLGHDVAMYQRVVPHG